MAEDIVVLREILQRELETINAYEKMLERVSDPSLKHIIEHVTDEEREHVAEMYQLIMERDPKQLARSLRGEQDLHTMRQASGPAPGSAADAAAPGTARATPAAGLASTAAAEAGLREPLVVPVTDDPFPPPPPIFPDGAWSVGSLKRSKLRGPGAPSPGT